MTNDLGIKGLDIKVLISALEDALAEEYLAWYAYSIEAPFLTGPNHLEIEELFQETAKDEYEDHAYWLMDRINKLGGNPSKILHPDWLNRKATHKYILPKAPFNVIDAINRNIEAEKNAIETYVKLEQMTRDKDVVTNKKMKEILADEQDHLQDLLEWKDACQNGKPISAKRNGGKFSYVDYLK